LGTVGILFGTASYGTPDAHLSLGLGTPFIFSNGSGTNSFARDVLVAVSGNLRLTQRVALVTENWVIPSLFDNSYGQQQLPMINSLAVRMLGERWAVDLGLIRVPQVGFPIPWLDFTYNFG
jgi:hypothetical protein